MRRPIQKIDLIKIISKSLDFIKLTSKNKIDLNIKTKNKLFMAMKFNLTEFLLIWLWSRRIFFIKKSLFKGNIDIEINDNNDYIVIRLTDNGTGITDSKKAMTPYFTTKKTGTGLGLPIVTKIINEHSGNFSIKNRKENKGTLVIISLPKYA